MCNCDKTGRRCIVEKSNLNNYSKHLSGPEGCPPLETTAGLIQKKPAPGRIEIYQVDAFTDVVFGGNPAGVVPYAQGLSSDLMQKIAREINLSETAFVTDIRQTKAQGTHKANTGAETPDFEVRFFTPKTEVDLCGHATIATFWLLAELKLIRQEGANKSETESLPELDEEIRIYQQTKAGVLAVDLLLGCEGTPSRVMMAQNLPQVAFALDEPEIAKLEKILGAPKGCVVEFGKARPQAVSTGLLDLIVPVSSREAVFSMRPNIELLSQFCCEKKIVSVHCFSMDTMESAATVHSRDFAPAVGIPEEAATGTASGATGAYLVLNKLVDIKQPVTRIICEQGYVMKRPSIIHVEIGVSGSDITSVRVGGSAVTVMKAVMKVL